MNVVIKWSGVLAVVVAVLSLLVAVAGLHESPMVGGLGFVVVAILVNLAAVFLALRETKDQNAYGKQLMNGVLIGVIAGALIFLSSWAMLSVVFPDYLGEMKEGYTAFFEASGVPEDVMQQQIAQLEATTPVSQSMAGFIGTFFTSIIAAAIIGIFVRKR